MRLRRLHSLIFLEKLDFREQRHFCVELEVLTSKSEQH